MWPFSRRKAPKVESIPIAAPTSDPEDFSVLTVGQSRLTDSFIAINFGSDSQPRFTQASIHPLVDPRMKTVADVEVRVETQVVGYLRPPALNTALELLERHRASSLEIPVMIFSTPAGPEVRVHSSLG